MRKLTWLRRYICSQQPEWSLPRSGQVRRKQVRRRQIIQFHFVDRFEDG
jgi:hypothetical protein